MVKNRKIAVIDDEESIQKTLSLALGSEGYDVTIYRSASEAIDTIESNLPDLIILDIMMPGIDGITFCSLFRKKENSIPIIFLSSRVDELTKLEALERGGDDYLTKPFSIKELLVRISVCLRRVENYSESPVNPNKSCSGLVIDESGWQIYYDNHLINFSVTEFRIFTTLYKNPNVVYTREELMIKAYPEDSYISDRNVDTHITRIRKKVLKYNKAFKGIESVYGLGYRYKIQK